MAGVKISNLPAAGALTGSELVAVVQGGITSQTTAAAVAGTTGVSTFSAGSTGLTPATATSGAISLAGTLAVANGGTGVTTSTGTGNNVLSASPTFTGTLAAAAITASTTLGVTGVSTLTGGAVIQGLTVGLGANAVATNTAVGVVALASGSLSGGNNTAVGSSALTALTTGAFNTAIGQGALGGATGANYNTAVGVGSLLVNIGGQQNAAFGVGALAGNTYGNFNTAVGVNALEISTGSQNLALGQGAGNALTTGSNNTIIGSVAGTAGLSDTVIIAAGSAERMRIDSSGAMSVPAKILVGGPTSSAGAQGIQVYGSSATGAANVVQRAFANDANGANLLLVKTRGTTSTSADLVSNDDTLGQIQFFGSNGTAPSNTALVYGKIGPSATWGATSSTSLPTLIGFSTTNTGATTASTRMTIDPDGAVNVYANVRVNQLSAIPAGGSQSQGLNFSSTANFGIFYGSGVPTLSAAQGSLYLRSDGSSTSTRMYVNTTGSTTWTAVTTAA